jgi:hypothetical protein|tara:strand:- start:1214 stop:1369 length:156 start_codon:yes stop_codon:yes gene_type:complete
MSTSMYIVGFVIFSVYMYFTIWNIYNGSKKMEEDYYQRHKQPTPSDTPKKQ